ncbi:MAG: hypothetical protein FJ091_21190 [Deltaproteobacteria bacterium]|nr:hypothetical protein [Deltaproteobacteria bacterium]
MAQLKAGSRLKSTVCDTQVMVIAAPAGDLALTCGGAPLADVTAQVAKGEINPDHKDGTQIGKRYVNEDGKLELLCTKPGQGALALGGVKLKLKEAKALPSSD